MLGESKKYLFVPFCQTQQLVPLCVGAREVRTEHGAMSRVIVKACSPCAICSDIPQVPRHLFPWRLLPGEAQLLVSPNRTPVVFSPSFQESGFGDCRSMPGKIGGSRGCHGKCEVERRGEPHIRTLQRVGFFLARAQVCRRAVIFKTFAPQAEQFYGKALGRAAGAQEKSDCAGIHRSFTPEKG